MARPKKTGSDTCKPGQKQREREKCYDTPANQETFSFWSGIPITALWASSISILHPFESKYEKVYGIFRYLNIWKIYGRIWAPASRIGHSGGLPPPWTHCISLSWVYLQWGHLVSNWIIRICPVFVFVYIFVFHFSVMCLFAIRNWVRN